MDYVSDAIRQKVGKKTWAEVYINSLDECRCLIIVSSLTYLI